MFSSRITSVNEDFLIIFKCVSIATASQSALTRNKKKIAERIIIVIA